MRRVMVGLFASLVMFYVVGCSTIEQAGNDDARTLVYGLSLQPSGFDPHQHVSAEMGIVLRQVYDTLVYRDPETYEFVPGLAHSWTVSDDGLVYTFSLRDDVTFHDGTPFNAQAVAANLERITNPETGSRRAVFMLGPYARYGIVDDYTIQLFLSEPYSPLLDSLSQVYLGMASPTAFNSMSVDRYQFHQVGTGPFTFEEYVPGDRLVLRRNTAYAWSPPFYQAPAENAVERVVYRFLTDPPVRTLSLETGEVHVAGELLPVDARAITASNELNLVTADVPGQPMQFLMNTERFPTDRIEVRQALLYGTNRDAIVDAVYQRFSPVAWGPLAANTLYYNSDVVGMYSQDTAQAQALLTAAGFEDTDDNGILDVGGVDVELRLLVPPWNFTPEVAQLLQDQWRTLGLRVVIDQVPGFTALVEAVEEGEYNLVAFNSVGLDPSLLNEYYLSDGSNNWTGFGNPDLDAVLNEAVARREPEVRAALYAQVQTYVMEQALVLPIRDYVNLNGASVFADNLSYDAYGWFPIINNMTVIN